MSPGSASAGSDPTSWPFPAGWQVDRLSPPAVPEGVPLEEAVSRALEAPVAGLRLRDRVRPGMRVTIAVSDATRPSPEPVFLQGLLEELGRGGVEPEAVTVLVGLGLHRNMTAAERGARRGGVLVRFEESSGAEPSAFLDRGELRPFGDLRLPVVLHRRTLEADLLLATGVVEPHQYAGYSGGAKTVAVGCAGAATIGALHGAEMVDHPGVRIGNLRNNPFQDTVREIARRAGLVFVLNLALRENQVVAVAAGEPGAVHDHLAARLAPDLWCSAGPRTYDVLLAVVPASKSGSLYQASRALTYLAAAPYPALRDGGWIVLVADCPEGPGSGAGALAFRKGMEAGDDPGAVVIRLRKEGFGPGGQRAYVLAQALTRYRGLVVGAGDPESAGVCHLEHAPDPGEAIRRLGTALGPSARILIVPRPMEQIPTLDGDQG